MMSAFFSAADSLRPENTAQLPDAAESAVHKLVPERLLYVAFFIAFTIPNLIFSGKYFFDTLHIMKWTVAMVPIALVAIAAGVNLLRFGATKTDFTIDRFALVWLFLLFFITMQPMFVRLTSISTFVKEWFFVACLFFVYLIAYNTSLSNRFHRLLLWGANINAAINLLFAEIVTKGNMNKGFPFILDVSSINFVGNIAQQEMFGVWMAMAVINSFFLHIAYISNNESRSIYRTPATWYNLLLLAINAWGLWASTARAAIFAFLLAFFIMLMILVKNKSTTAAKHGLALFLLVIALLAGSVALNATFNVGRSNFLVHKMSDILDNPTNVAGRMSIWQTSWEIFLKKPVTGVGLGHYKWHYIDGQRILFAKYPELLSAKGYEWQFTYWAHSEYVQWLCETGIIGAVILAALGLWWLFCFGRRFMQKEPIPLQAAWGFSLLFLLWFDALFSRPFHRFEISIWMSLAFALTNRSMFSKTAESAHNTKDVYFKCFGALTAGIALYGLFFLGGGIIADQLMYKSLAERSSAEEKSMLLAKAERSLMARDDVFEQKAYFYLMLADADKNPEFFAAGIQQLYMAFHRRPGSRVFFDLIKHAKRLENQELLQNLAPYLTPGMFGLSQQGKIISP